MGNQLMRGPYMLSVMCNNDNAHSNTLSAHCRSPCFILFSLYTLVKLFDLYFGNMSVSYLAV
jgi:hypothetical protein